MKRILAFMMVLTVALSLAAPAAACTPKLGAPEIPSVPELQVKIQLPADFLRRWFQEHPITLPTVPTEPTVPETKPTTTELEAPEITDAKYVHGTSAWNMSRLEVCWTAVEGAEHYEVLISKADGEAITYTTAKTNLFCTDAACPRVYIAEDSLWAAAAVMVRAVAGNVFGPWSEPEKLGCNGIH